MSAQGSRTSEIDKVIETLDGELMSVPPTPSRTPRGYSWRATTDVEPGMVIARPVVGITGSRATLHLAIGSVITTDMLAQLVNKGVECVAVLDRHAPDPEIYADIVLKYEARLRAIFEPKPDATCRPLFDALIRYGPPGC